MHNKIFQSIIGVTAFAALLFAVVVGIETSETATNQTAQVSRSISTTTKTSDTELKTEEVSKEISNISSRVGLLLRILDDAKPTFEKGETNSYVRIAQNLLNTLGYPVPLSGVYDELTEDAVTALQYKLQIKPDGMLSSGVLRTIRERVLVRDSNSSSAYSLNQESLVSVIPSFTSPPSLAFEDIILVVPADLCRAIGGTVSTATGWCIVRGGGGNGTGGSNPPPGGPPGYTGGPDFTNPGSYNPNWNGNTGGDDTPQGGGGGSNPGSSGTNTNCRTTSVFGCPEDDDVCPNLTGNQTTVPDGYTFDAAEGVCVQSSGSGPGNNNNNDDGEPTTPPVQVIGEIVELDTVLPAQYHFFGALFIGLDLPSRENYTLGLQLYQETGNLPDFVMGGFLQKPMQWYQNTRQTPLGQIFFGNLNNLFGWARGGFDTTPEYYNPDDFDPEDPSTWPYVPTFPPRAIRPINMPETACPPGDVDCFLGEQPPLFGSGNRQQQQGSYYDHDELGEQTALDALISSVSSDPNQKRKYIYDAEFNLLEVSPEEHNEIWIENQYTGEQEKIMVDGNLYVDLWPLEPIAEGTPYDRVFKALAAKNLDRLNDLTVALLSSVNIDITETGINEVVVGELSNFRDFSSRVSSMEEDYGSSKVLIADNPGYFEAYLGVQLSTVTGRDVAENTASENTAVSTPLHLLATSYMNFLKTRRDYMLEVVFDQLNQLEIPGGEIRHPDVPYYVRYSGPETQDWGAWKHSYLYVSTDSYRIEMKNTGRAIVQAILDDAVSEYLSQDYKNNLNDLLVEIYAPTNPNNMISSNPIIERIPEIPEFDEVAETSFYDIYDFNYVE